MKDPVFFQHHFLLAMPTVEDDVFRHAVIYICEHNSNGAVGVIINRPTALSLLDVLNNMVIHAQDDIVRHIPILFGGPVNQERGFVIHRPQGNWQSTIDANDEIFITVSRDILDAMAVHQGPSEVLVTLGCCTWAAGQLEDELKNNLWLNMPAHPNIIFESPFETRYTEAMSLLGIDVINLVSEAGHA